MKPEHENIEYCANLFAESLFCNPDNNIFHESTRSINCITRYQILNGLHSVLSNKLNFPQSVKIKARRLKIYFRYSLLYILAGILI